MKSRYRLIVLVLVLIVTSCSSNNQGQTTSKANQTAGKLFIIGGGDRPATMVQKMIDASGLSENGYAVVLPMSSSIPDTSAYYGMLQFQELGVKNITAFNFADSSLKNIAVKLDSLQNANLIYITGGVQSRFMKSVQNTPGLKKAIFSAYNNGALIAGTSAGAAVMSQIMITGDQLKHPEYTSTFYHLEANNIDTARGLGIIKNIIVDQHFLKRARNNRLLTAVMEFPEKIGVGIDESTAIIIDNDSVKVVGKSHVLVYRNLSGTSHTTDGKIAAKNIRLDIYLPGESFLIDGVN